MGGDLASGIDPKEHHKKQETADKHALTMDAFFGIYLEKHKKVHNKEGTLKRDIPRIKNIILPSLGTKKVSEITEEDILTLQDRLRHTPIEFNRCNALLSKAFNLGELWGYRPKNSNPCHGIAKFPEKKKERFLTQEELQSLDKTLKQA